MAMAAEEQQIPPTPNTVPNNLRYQSFLDNLHDFQSRGSKSQIRKSQEKIITSFQTPLPDKTVSGNERDFVYRLENSRPGPIPEVDRNPNFQDVDGLININVRQNSQLRVNNGEKLLKEIAGIHDQENLPDNYEFIFMFDACSELTYCFLDNPNVYAIVTPEVIGDSAASCGNEQGYFKEDIMPQTPNIEHISPRRVIHFNSRIQHGEHLSLGTQIQYNVPPENDLYKSNAMEAYGNRNKDKLDINKQFNILINGGEFKNGNINCSSGTSVSILHKFLGFIHTPEKPITSFKPRFSSFKMFNPFENMFSRITQAQAQDINKDSFCLDYKRGGDFNQAHSLREFILQLNERQENNLTTPMMLNDPETGDTHTVYVVFASGDYFSAYHAAKYCGLRSIYFNGVKEKRKRGISFSTRRPEKKTLSGKIHSWMGNNHSYAIFNSGRNPVIHTNQDVNFNDNMLNLEYIKILSHPFDDVILSRNEDHINQEFDFQLIKDTIETAIKICTDDTINDDYEEVNQGTTAGQAEDRTGQTGGFIADKLTNDGKNINDDKQFFQNLLKVKNSHINIIKISINIYENIMKLIKFNINSYLQHPDDENGLDVFSLSKTHLIVEKNDERRWGNITAEKLLSDEQQYTQYTLFDILILYLINHRCNEYNQNVWTSKDQSYPFKEIHIDHANNKSYFFYQHPRKNVQPKKLVMVMVDI